ncbi:hypothetical protein FJY63_02690 [Candidatus Sumerlaeota bacterium]|nr:hypothetical protein [Candidatus Sumerlaeota bacterium]
MTSLEGLLAALSEENLARSVAIPHDEARMAYDGIRSAIVRDFSDFCRIIGDYCAYHFARCVGGRLNQIDATALAKEIVSTHYRQRHRGNIVSAFHDARLGMQNGIRGILDIIADGLKAEALERFTREVFDHFVPPDNWNEQYEIVKGFILRCGVDMSPRITVADTHKYARDYEELIRTYCSTLRQQSAVFRRI